MDIALVAYGRPDGTDAVKVSLNRIEEIMPGKGPEIEEPIKGRNGGLFTNFGDYSVNLWQNIKLYGENQSRSLFDLAALVVLKHPEYSKKKQISTPYWQNGRWVEGQTKSTTGLYYNFESDSIINEFIQSLTDCNIK